MTKWKLMTVLIASIFLSSWSEAASTDDLIRLYVLSDGSKAVGVVSIDGGKFISIKDPVTGIAKTFERSIIVSESTEFSDINAARPKEFQFDRSLHTLVGVLQIQIVNYAKGNPIYKNIEMSIPIPHSARMATVSGQVLSLSLSDSEGQTSEARWILPIRLSGEFKVGKSDTVETAVVSIKSHFVRWVNENNVLAIHPEQGVLQMSASSVLADGTMGLFESNNDDMYIGDVWFGWVARPDLANSDVFLNATDPLLADAESIVVSYKEFGSRVTHIKRKLKRIRSRSVRCSSCNGKGKRYVEQKVYAINGRYATSGSWYSCKKCNQKGVIRQEYGPSAGYQRVANEYIVFLEETAGKAEDALSRIVRLKERVRNAALEEVDNTSFFELYDEINEFNKIWTSNKNTSKLMEKQLQKYWFQ